MRSDWDSTRACEGSASELPGENDEKTRSGEAIFQM